MYAQFIVGLLSFTSSFSSISSSGTSSHLLDILAGRCFEYTTILNKSSSYDCREILDSFLEAFSYKEPCTLTEKSYDVFMSITAPRIPENKAIFWSGTYTIAHEYAGYGKRYITLEDTLVGHLANGLTWCGTTEKPGINYQRCPSYSECSDEANKAFWGAASKNYALHTSGVVTLLLNGSNPNLPAYRTDSFFAEFELPSLSTDTVTNVNILVIHDLNSQNREMCGTGSLLTLAKAIENKGLQYECFDDPQSIIYLLCVDDPDSRECRHVNHPMNYSEEILPP